MEEVNGKDINELMEDMTHKQLGLLVITKACNMQENETVNIMEFMNTCMLVLLAVEETTQISATNLFYTLEYIMGQLRHVADEGGILEIYKVKKKG